MLVNCLTILLTTVERKKVVEHMSNFLIICDELIEDGIVLTLNQEDILSQIYKKQRDSFSLTSVYYYIDNYIGKENTSWMILIIIQINELCLPIFSCK